MTEKVLGLPEKNLVDFVQRNWFKMHGGQISITQGQSLLVPVVSLEALEKYCKKLSFEQFGSVERYNSKKMQENIKTFDVLSWAKKECEKK